MNNWFFDYDEDTVYQIINPECFITYPTEVDAIKSGIQNYLDRAEFIRKKFADILKES